MGASMGSAPSVTVVKPSPPKLEEMGKRKTINPMIAKLSNRSSVEMKNPFSSKANDKPKL